MKYIDEFRSSSAAQALAQKITETLDGRKVTLMEICGGHTLSIFKYGLLDLLPDSVQLIHGPGCPVCVTTNAYIDAAVALAAHKKNIICTFGDLMKVPGSTRSLHDAKAAGGDIRTVYSPLDALALAADNPAHIVVFLAVGFETTIPASAVTVKTAYERQCGNFFILSAHKMTPPAMQVIVNDPEIALDGFICPGHVTTIIGAEPYRFLADEFALPCSIAGFEPLDVLHSILQLCRMYVEKKTDIAINYSRAVRPEGNIAAQKVIAEVFKPADTLWRGFGTIPMSGYVLADTYADFDAVRMLDYTPEPLLEHAGCICGDVLRGKVKPTACPLFGNTCTPEAPVGACMVSSEGACATYYHYGR